MPTSVAQTSARSSEGSGAENSREENDALFLLPKFILVKLRIIRLICQASVLYHLKNKTLLETSCAKFIIVTDLMEFKVNVRLCSKLLSGLFVMRHEYRFFCVCGEYRSEINTDLFDKVILVFLTSPLIAAAFFFSLPHFLKSDAKAKYKPTFDIGNNTWSAF